MAAGSTVYADEAASWDALHASFEARRISRTPAFKGCCAYQMGLFLSRLRRAEIGVYHRITHHLHQYAGEMAWREDTRRLPNGMLYLLAAGAALGHPVSRSWSGHWQQRRT